MNDLDQPLDVTRLAIYTNKINEISSISKMMVPTYLRDFIIGQDVATGLLALAVREDARAKAKLEFTQSVAYLEKAKSYLESKGIKDTSEARKQYIDRDDDVLSAKEEKAKTEALVVLLKGKLNELIRAHDDLKKVTYADSQMSPYEGM